MESGKSPLWVQDPKSKLFVDLFAGEEMQKEFASMEEEINTVFQLHQYSSKKSDAAASKLRHRGNELYQDEKYEEAIEKYNESACHAENGSTELALVYANRSSCFLKLGMYRECLIDIAMAKKLNYPEESMYKLDSRLSVCVQALSIRDASAEKFDRQAQLSFEPHPKYDGAANCFDIRQSKAFGRHIVATRDMEIGQTILIEEPYATAVTNEITGEPNNVRFDRCAHCFKKLVNLVPCEKCNHTLFCDDECSRNAKQDHHEYDCELSFLGKECRVLDACLTYKTIQSFESAKELMKVVDKLLHGDAIPVNLKEEQLKFAMIFQLATNKDKKLNDLQTELITNTMPIYFILMKFLHFDQKFVSEAERRFLKQLIFHYQHIIEYGIKFCDTKTAEGVVDFALHPEMIYSLGFFVLGSYFNHSCVPNVVCYTVDKRLIYRVIRPIKEGEQLFRSYSSTSHHEPCSLVQFILKNDFHFECKCSVCSEERDQEREEHSVKEALCRKESIVERVLHPGNLSKMSKESMQQIDNDIIAFLRKYDGSVHPSATTVMMQRVLQHLWMTTKSQE